MYFAISINADVRREFTIQMTMIAFHTVINSAMNNAIQQN
jgi:hypothetical protein